MNYFNTRYTYHTGRDKVWIAITEYLQKYINPKSKIVDLGTGYCNFINNIKAANKIAVDLDGESKKHCDKNILFIKTESDNLADIKDHTIDVVFSSNLFEHLTDDQLDSTIKEIKRILKNKGRLIIIQPNYRYAYKNYFDDFTHKKVFSHIALEDYLKSKDLKPVVVMPKFLPLSLKSKLPKSYILTKLYLNSPIKPLAKQMLLIVER